MRILCWLPCVALLVAASATAKEAQCPLDVATCLGQYQRMRERPWLGVGIETDSLGRRLIARVEPNSPAARAGLEVGDVLEKIEGQDPQQWFAGKAGWKSGESGDIGVKRGGKGKTLPLKYEPVPEEVFARIIGVHMIEGHLAYMPKHEEGEEHRH